MTRRNIGVGGDNQDQSWIGTLAVAFVIVSALIAILICIFVV